MEPTLRGPGWPANPGGFGFVRSRVVTDSMQLASGSTFFAVGFTDSAERCTLRDGWPMRSHEGPHRYKGHRPARRFALVDPHDARHRRGHCRVRAQRGENDARLEADWSAAVLGCRRPDGSR